MNEIQVPTQTFLEQVKQELGEKDLQIILLRSQIAALREKLSQLLEDPNTDNANGIQE